MQLYIVPGDWGEVQLDDIEKLLKNTAFHLNKLFRVPFKGTIYVKPSEEGFPRVLVRKFPGQPFVIKLSARGSDCCPFVYEFSHEFCHVLSGFECLEPEPNRVAKPNNWFHEAICELASVFTLRHMAKQWSSPPAYAHWADRAKALQDYSQERLSSPEVKLPEGATLQSWLSSHEAALSENRYLRKKNALVAYALLPIFESEPTGWNAVQSLPDSEGRLAEYFVDWYRSADNADKDFIARLANEFDYAIS